MRISGGVMMCEKVSPSEQLLFFSRRIGQGAYSSQEGLKGEKSKS